MVFWRKSRAGFECTATGRVFEVDWQRRDVQYYVNMRDIKLPVRFRDDSGAFGPRGRAEVSAGLTRRIKNLRRSRSRYRPKKKRQSELTAEEVDWMVMQLIREGS